VLQPMPATRTCAALAAASEAREARAVVAADCVGTRGVRAAAMGAHGALIHVWRKRGQRRGGSGYGGSRDVGINAHPVHTCSLETTAPPEQSVPLPSKPGLHAQLKLPTVLLHVASGWQLFNIRSRHSLMSGRVDGGTGGGGGRKGKGWEGTMRKARPAASFSETRTRPAARSGPSALAGRSYSCCAVTTPLRVCVRSGTAAPVHTLPVPIKPLRHSLREGGRSKVEQGGAAGCPWVGLLTCTRLQLCRQDHK
jgi:hypothetical protein